MKPSLDARRGPSAQLVAPNCEHFGSREIANVVHGYGRLRRCGLDLGVIPLGGGPRGLDASTRVGGGVV